MATQRCSYSEYNKPIFLEKQITKKAVPSCIIVVPILYYNNIRVFTIIVVLTLNRLKIIRIYL